MQKLFPRFVARFAIQSVFCQWLSFNVSWFKELLVMKTWSHYVCNSRRRRKSELLDDLWWSKRRQRTWFDYVSRAPTTKGPRTRTTTGVILVSFMSFFHLKYTQHNHLSFIVLYKTTSCPFPIWNKYFGLFVSTILLAEARLLGKCCSKLSVQIFPQSTSQIVILGW